MRIGVISQEVYPLFYGGIGVQISLLTEHLVGLGHTVEFFTRRPPSEHSERQAPMFEKVRFRFIEPASKGDYLCSLGYARDVAACLRQVHEQAPLDLIIATDFGGDSFFVQLDPPCSRSGVPVPIIMTLHGASRDVNQANSKEVTAEDEILCLQEEIAILSSSICLTPSSMYWGSLAKRLPLAGMPFAVVPNFFSEKLFSRPVEHVTAPGTAKRLVYVGRLEPRKGVDLLMEAFSILVDRDMSLELHLVGRDIVWSEYGTSFEEYWKARLPAAVARRVFFHGNQEHEEVYRLLSSAHVAVFPSRWEPFGIVALEALAAGVPVVVPEATGLAEIVGDDGGIVVNQPCTPHALADAVNRILADEALRERLAVSARQRAAQLLNQAQTGLTEIVAKVGRQEVRARPAVPGAHVAKLQQLVWEFGSSIADRRATRIEELSRQVEERDAIIQRQADAILNKDAGIVSRDQELARREVAARELEEEVTRLQRELTERDAQLTANSEAQKTASKRRWWQCGGSTRTEG